MDATNKPKKVGFAYSRLSQRERHKLSAGDIETSLINAKNDIDSYCKHEGVELLYFGEERYKTGAKWERAVIKETITKAKEHALGHADEIANGSLVVHFIFKNLSRMAREGVFQETNLREMEDPPYYIQIVSIEEGEIIKDRSMRLMLGAMNERLVLEGRKSTKKRHNDALNAGIPPIKAPFGYWNDKNVRNWVINKKASKVVVEFWKLFAEGLEYKDVCSKLKISIGQYYRLIENFDNYLGKIIYRKKIKDFRGRVIKVNKIVYDGKHKPILEDPELIERIKKRLD